jgi:adenosine deaminase
MTTRDQPSLSWIKTLAKAELHCHLNGSVRPSTMAELGGDATTSTDVVHTIEDAFRVFKKVYSVITTEAVLRRIVRETLEDARADNVVYLELRTTPRVLLDISTRREYVEVVIDEISKFHALNTSRPLVAFPEGTIAVRLILTIDRSKSLEDADETISMASAFRDVVVGIDFAGNPTIGSFSTFKDVFKRATSEGLFTTVHTSEITGVGAETDAILEFRPDRVGHFLFPTEAQVDKLVKSGIMIESCPSSNMCAITGKNPTDMCLDGHNTLGKFLHMGHPIVSINTDDPGVFGKNLSDELFAVAKTFALKEHEVRQLIRSSGEHAFLHSAERSALAAVLGKEVCLGE